MNRRNYLSTLTAGIVPFLNDEWREQLWSETDPPSATESPALRDFLVPESALDDAYTPIAPGPMTLNPVSESSEQSLCRRTVTTRDEDGNQIQYYVAEKGYAVPTTGEMVAEKEAKLTTKALKPTDYQRLRLPQMISISTCTMTGGDQVTGESKITRPNWSKSSRTSGLPQINGRNICTTTSIVS